VACKCHCSVGFELDASLSDHRKNLIDILRILRQCGRRVGRARIKFTACPEPADATFVECAIYSSSEIQRHYYEFRGLGLADLPDASNARKQPSRVSAGPVRGAPILLLLPLQLSFSTGPHEKTSAAPGSGLLDATPDAGPTHSRVPSLLRGARQQLKAIV